MSLKIMEDVQSGVRNLGVCEGMYLFIYISLSVSKEVVLGTEEVQKLSLREFHP